MASATDIYSAVASHYSAASAGRTTNGVYESTVATAFGYTTEELASIPENANLGLSCGNPHVLAALRQGEVVVDLGSGAGFDVFLAARKVGPTGLAIGVDMNKDMLEKAEENKKKSGTANVDFIEARITQINPLVDSTVDCIISNCVINLVPEEEKKLVFNEMYRLLKPGGRVAISDILIKDGKNLPDNLKSDMALLVGCIAGASFVSGYEHYLRQAGFDDILIVDNKKNLNVYNADVGPGESAKSCCGTGVQSTTSTKSQPVSKSCCGTSAPASASTQTGSTCSDKTATPVQTNGVAIASSHLKDIDFNLYAGSYNIYAVKSR